MSDAAARELEVLAAKSERQGQRYADHALIWVVITIVLAFCLRWAVPVTGLAAIGSLVNSRQSHAAARRLRERLAAAR